MWRPDNRRRLRGIGLAASGVAAAALYVGVVAWARWSGTVHLRLLYDGLAPPARYHWVRPPAPLARDNQPPASGAGEIRFGGAVSHGALIYTAEGQALATFPPDAVVAQPDEAAADARIRPLDPDALAPPPPGLRFDGNAYEIHAVYRSARTPVVLRRPVPIILRYATGATQVLRFSGATWTPVTSTDFPAALTRTFDAPTLGVFVTAAPAELPYVHRTPLWMYAGVGTAVLGILALVVWSIRTGRVRRRSDPAVRKRRG